MRTVNSKISIKTLDELKAEGFISNTTNSVFHIFSPVAWTFMRDDPSLGKVGVNIVEVDQNDPKVPYRITGGMWVPDFMVKDYVEPTVDPSAITRPTATRAEGDRVRYGKIFKFLIALEKEIIGTRIIWSANINRLSKLSPDILSYIQNILKAKYPDYEVIDGNPVEIASHIVDTVEENAED